MKGMLISLAFLLAAIAFTAANATAVNNHLERVEAALDAIPKTENALPQKRVAELCNEALEIWEKKESLLSATIHQTELRDCRLAIEAVCALAASSEYADLVAALYEARLRITNLRKRESLSLQNLI